jgi:hypothetical protein
MKGTTYMIRHGTGICGFKKWAGIEPPCSVWSSGLPPRRGFLRRSRSRILPISFPRKNPRRRRKNPFPFRSWYRRTDYPALGAAQSVPVGPGSRYSRALSPDFTPESLDQYTKWLPGTGYSHASFPQCRQRYDYYYRVTSVVTGREAGMSGHFQSGKGGCRQKTDPAESGDDEQSLQNDGRPHDPTAHRHSGRFIQSGASRPSPVAQDAL